VDLGISSMATCSDGAVIANPKALRTNLKRLKRLQRHVSRKRKGSKSRDKARKQLARQHARVAHLRRDALHKATSALTRAQLTPEAREARRFQLASTMPEPKTKVKSAKSKRRVGEEAPPELERRAGQVQKHQVKRLLRQPTEVDVSMRPRVIILEDLGVAGMLKNHHLAQAIADVGLAEFRRQVVYKSGWQGEQVLFANRFYPSTKRCSECGNVKAEMSLSERVYVCEVVSCQLSIGRDFNAAKNLAALAR
jgi:transposase